MNVLFLGGPWHEQRHEVPEPLPEQLNVAQPWPPMGLVADVLGLDTAPAGPPAVAYQLKGEGGRRAYVASDYASLVLPLAMPDWLATRLRESFPGVRQWVTWQTWQLPVADIPDDRYGAWRGFDATRRVTVFVLADPDGDGSTWRVAVREVADEAMARITDVEAVVARRLQAELMHVALPECVVPGCREKAPVVFTAAEHGRLAGRDWRPGDEIRLCPAHSYDVWRAQGVYGLDELAEWLRPDAKLAPIDAFDADTGTIFGHEISSQRRRMMALQRMSGG